MLTDVFFRRYEKRHMFDAVGPKEQALFVQAYRIINEQIWSYYGADKKVDESVKATWTRLHDRLTMEMGIKELSPKYYSYQGELMGKPHVYSGWNDINFVVEQWLNLPFSDKWDPDVFVKRRLSFIELAFREREVQVAAANANIPQALQQAAVMDARYRAKGVQSFTSSVESVKTRNELMNTTFTAQVHELNTRLEQAGMPLHYHNGYIQIKEDVQVQDQIEQPFWELVKDAKWMNVSIDMAEAIDRRDTNGRDPSFYAAKALESTIKIICDEKGWTNGAEKGASDYLNHLESKANGGLIKPWERQMIQKIFSDVRNDLGHGPGSAQMPQLTDAQVHFTIEFCMSSIKSLINRL